jgi:hypothetical protein
MQVQLAVDDVARGDAMAVNRLTTTSSRARSSVR